MKRILLILIVLLAGCAQPIKESPVKKTLDIQSLIEIIVHENNFGSGVEADDYTIEVDKAKLSNLIYKDEQKVKNIPENKVSPEKMLELGRSMSSLKTKLLKSEKLTNLTTKLETNQANEGDEFVLEFFYNKDDATKLGYEIINNKIKFVVSNGKITIK